MWRSLIPSPAHPPSKPGGICSSLPLVSILVNGRQPILCSCSPALLTNRDPNKFLCCYRIFFLPHLHRLVLHHVEGNYTFIYYIASNIKPRKLYQRQQLFNHPSRDPFPKTIPLLHPGSHYSLKIADFQGLLHLWVLLGRVCAEVLVGELGNTMLPLRA